ncbi:MAG: CRTAC1 family protein, partial [Planctomycetota bacterium]|nr:CRTAC1 family protein [Planctomycetota bacterium]
ADVDGDGDLDLYIPGVGEDGAGRLYVNEGERLVARDDSDTGIDGRGAVAAYFGDHDGDGDPDLFLTRAGPNRLYRNDGGGRFADVTEASGVAGGAYLSVGAAWVDADHDGDLDLYVANFASVAPAEESTGAPNQLLQNNGDGTFTDVAATAGVYAGAAPSVAVVFLDVDADRDLDLWVLQHGSPNRLFLNDRVGRYRDGAGSYPDLVGAGPGLGALLGDVGGAGAQDLVLLRLEASPRLFLGTQGGRFSEDRGAFGAALGSVGGASSGLLEDLDLDGDLDLVLLGAVAGGRAGHRILMNRGGGRFAPPLPLGAEREAPDARGALAVDLDGDGGLELVVVRAGARPELWRAPAPAGRHWLEVIPAPAGAGAGGSEVSKASTAVGLEVEVKTGQRLQVAVVRSSSGYLGGRPPRLHFGLGEHGKADYVRLTWPDAVLQSEIEVAANQSWRVPKVIRKPSSCPLLFSWDGERFAFVTDFLGVGGLGFFVEPGSYAPPDPTEDVRIPPGLIAPRDGRYLIRVAEPLEEVSYIDELLLLAYDHPAGQEVYPDERFTATAPFPSGRPVAVREKIFPVRASVTGGGLTGRDVTDRLLEIDRRYVEPPADARFIGYADDHSIELDFGERLRGIPAGARLVLVLHGWVEYTYSHVNYAAYQAGLRMRPPAIEVPDGDGGWRVVREDVGFPAGLPRSVVIDVTSLPVRGGRLRIRTNMQVYWDQVFAAVDVSGEALRRHSLRPSMAELRPLGYPQETSPDGREPVVYDYHRLESGVAFKILTGNFTRLGDVRELLDEVDDRFVIIARGEEIALEFDAGSLPELPAGWSRTFVLRADGYSKDMDLYTAFPDTVEPLPFHAMENYPPRKPAPESAARAEYLRDWCTRRIEGR